MEVEELFAATFIMAMFAGVFLVYLALKQRSQILEMQHRERMAMIERGQVPLDEGTRSRAGSGGVSSTRSLSVGIVVVGVGLAMMTLVGVAGGSAEVGVGVGGAIAILGAAFIVRSLVVRPQPSDSTPPVPRDLP